MIAQFNNLSDIEAVQMIDAIALITILIGGADDDLDPAEIAWSKKLTAYRAFTSPEILQDYYKEVGKDYPERLEALIKSLPDTAEKRTPVISERLAKLNDSFSKLDAEFANALHGSFVSFAHHVAKESGGILRFFSVGSEEKKLMDLPMLEI